MYKGYRKAAARSSKYGIGRDSMRGFRDYFLIYVNKLVYFICLAIRQFDTLIVNLENSYFSTCAIDICMEI